MQDKQLTEQPHVWAMQILAIFAEMEVCAGIKESFSYIYDSCSFVTTQLTHRRLWLLTLIKQ
jgi:hypothetical protein